MPDITSLIQSNAGNPWFYLPLAVVLGALHALEPGHSKSLMAAFIVAVRGTKAQASLLGLSAAIGHSIVVWALALAALYFGDKLLIDRAEPWLIFLSGLLIVGLALRLILSLRHDGDDHDHDHDHAHDHDHTHDHAHKPAPAVYVFDTHAAAHAKSISKQFSGPRQVTNPEIIWFGFTGGLLPCPSAIAVLLICIQLKAWGLGVAMVFAFSLGLAITMITIGVIAAAGTKMATSRWQGFDRWAERIPYLSGGLVMAMGLFISVRGLVALGVL